MPVSDEATILSALQQGVTAAVAASSNPTLPIQYVDVDFSIPDDKKWLEIVYLPNNRTGDFWSNQQNHQGMMRLILHWPNDGDGAYVALALLGSVCDYFAVGQILSGVQIYEIPGFSGALREGDELLYPVSIRYQSYRS